MSFEITRRFQGETIDCDVLQWFPHRLFDSKAADASVLHRAPQQTTVLGVGIGGEWKQKSFLLDPKLRACRVGSGWFLISDVDAASQFAVEKDNPVAFPHDKKPIYVSGHVGLHVHLESTGETFTLAFPGYELADVAFDALNRLSYDELSLEIFEARADEVVDENKAGDDSSAAADGSKPKQLKRRSSMAGAAAKQKDQQNGKNNDDDFDDMHDQDDNIFVANSGSELIERGHMVNTNDFVTHFIEGGGMGSLSEQAQTGSGGGAPSGGVMRLRKETGSLSTWIARMEEGDDDHVFLLKLSKALIKAPLNKIIRASPPSIAKHFGPVVPLAFAHLTIRSETFQAQFILEETYTSDNGDRRIHRLICVFTSLEERVRWEDWFISHGVKKKAIDPSTIGGGKKDDDGAGGTGGGPGGAAARAASRQKDSTMRLIEECFNLDEIWQKPQHLPGGGGDIDDEDEEYDEEMDDIMYEDDGTMDPFVGDSPRAMESPRNSEFASFESARSSPRNSALISPRSHAAGGSSKSPSPSSPAGSPRSGSNKRSRKRSGGKDAGSPSSSPTVRGAGDGSTSPTMLKKDMPSKTQEEEVAEEEAAQRCRWFAGYEKPKKSKWDEISKVVKSESTSGAAVFSVAKFLTKQGSGDATTSEAAESPAGSLSELLGEDSMAHIPGTPRSPKKTMFTALMRAAQVEKAREAIERSSSPNGGSPASANQDGNFPPGGSPNRLDSTMRSPEHQACVDDLDAAEKEAADAVRNENTDMIVPGRGKLTTQQHKDAAAVDLGPLGGPRSPSALERYAAAQQTFSRLDQQQQQQQQQHDRSSKFGKDQEIDPHPGGPMFGRPTLFGALPSKFQPINLRSEGYIGQREVKDQVTKESGGGGSTPRGAGIITGSESNLPAGYSPSSRGNSPTTNRRGGGGETEISSSSVRRKYPGSPAADAAREFSFSFQGASPSVIRPIPRSNEWSSALKQEGDRSNNNAAAASALGEAAASGSSPARKKLVETSSDSDDESSRRFANARAMRAVSQLGEEFVGPGFASPNSGTKAAIGVTNLSSQLNPQCPLCGADRSQVAICKKSGRLHATYVPRYAGK